MTLRVYDVVIPKRNWFYDGHWWRAELRTGSKNHVVACLSNASGADPNILLANASDVIGGQGIAFAMKASTSYFNWAVGINYIQEKGDSQDTEATIVLGEELAKKYYSISLPEPENSVF